ncbi:exodeoxyribonuclease V subunit gamma [Nocardioides massiliensis]|uniref:RecBCD enzyme subunit RecC n=1 Tax=Nocardioides massiliensis TaxID=1325935 RepID=A0ABT9NSH8_9ACTN|nr:exodeoxyribonuclease V subunit gamma [Nocardioides massiliensis]MDP9823376.1 exodeoxyribonuclease V gamma subunit [Nocardioides massiliensis]
MTLILHRADRVDDLASGLGALLAQPLEDPFVQELVVVPARGVERWLAQTLAHRLGAGTRPGADDGVCAGVRMLSPGSLISLLLDRDRDDPWSPDRLVWQVLDVLEECAGQDWCATIAAHLGLTGGPEESAAMALRRQRRYAVARRVAGLFAAYAAQRPELVTAWDAGRAEDGLGSALDPDLAWQAELWRRVAARVRAESGLPTPPERVAGAVEALRAGTLELDLPPRLSLFGHTRITRTDAALLAALGEQRDVHLWLPQASGPLWERLAADATRGPVPRADVPSPSAEHPLLEALGRDARELQRTLGALGAEDRTPPAAADSTGAGDSLLGWLHDDLRGDRVPSAAKRAARRVRPDDRSIQVHACHGLARQVEVLREVLLGLLADDPELEPRDVIVLCPDVEQVAPLIHAAFGLAGATDVPEPDLHPAHGLRVRLADRALLSTNPLLSLAVALVDLAGARVTAAQVLDLVAREPVRRRFGFDEDDLAQLASWVRQASIRWGLDAEHRHGYGLDLRENSWRAGLDRILLGVAMADEGGRHLGPALPLDDVEGTRIDLAGRLAEVVDRLAGFVRRVADGASVDDWIDALGSTVHALADVARDDAWQRSQLDRELARVAAAGGEQRLLVADVRSLLRRLLAGRPTRSSFRTGTLTVCSMVPMRSVPHRVVCLLGLDDGVFPRLETVDGDDVLARTPVTGERDIRSEDRQLLLDAVLAAREHLVITYTGANEHTGTARPPAVPLGEVLDALDLTATAPDPATRLRDHVVRRHPLQPFDERNFAPEPFSFDPTALAGAQAARHARVTRPAILVRTPLLPEPLPPLPPADVSLAELREFVGNPVRWFLRRRLDVAAPLEAEELPVGIPLALNALQKWDVGERLMRTVFSGGTPHEAMLAEQLRGVLPPGPAGVRALEEVLKNVRPLHTAVAPLLDVPPRSVDVDIDLGGGRRLRGTVEGLRGHRRATVTYSRLGPRPRVQSWVDLLALTVGLPDQHWTAAAIGRGPRSQVSQTLLGPLDHQAELWLHELVDLFDRGTCEPLPLPLKTAAAYAEERDAEMRGVPTKDVWEKARSAWETPRFAEDGFVQEDRDVHHQRAFGGQLTLDELRAIAPRDDEWWFPGEDSRLGQLALRLWTPLLAAARTGAL